MKKLICVLLALMLALMLAACGSKEAAPAATEAPAAEEPAETTDMLARIQANGELVIATEGAWRPWTYHDEDDNLVGYDVEVATLIAEKLGVTPKFVETEWEGIFAGLKDRYDIAANGVDVTPEREEAYAFSTPYGYNRTALVVRGDNEDITSFEDLKDKTTCNSIGSTYMELAESYGAKTDGVSTLDLTIENVLNGHADATLNAELSIYDYLSEHPDANIKIVARTDEANAVAIPMRKADVEDNESFLAAINAAIEELRAEGELTRLSEKYFGSDISTKQ